MSYQHLSCTSLDSVIIRKLESIKVFSVNDFLLAETRLLSKCSEIPINEIFKIKKDFASRFATQFTSGLNWFKEVSGYEKVPTFIDSLDELLNGGINSIFEVCGLSGSGKTQLCLTITLNVALNLGKKILYIDSKDEMSATRLQFILKKLKKSDSEIDDVLERIDVVSIKNMYELMTKLSSLQKDLLEKSAVPYKLIIIDSMTVLFFPYISASGNEGLAFLNYIYSTLRTISVGFKTGILLTNLGTQYCEVGDDTEMVESEIKPLLGKYWTHVPDTRLTIQKCTDSIKERLIQVTKSCNLPLGGTCVVKIGDFGVCSL